MKDRRISMTTKTLAYTSALVLALSAGVLGYAKDARAADPSAMDRAGAAVGNKVDQAVGPNNPITADELSAAVPLTSVSDPAKALATAEIKNPAGEPIGTVSSVDVTSKGEAKAVHADVGGFLGMGSHPVALKASKLTYLQSRNLIVTHMTKDQIKALPQEASAH
jgi:hypothetical protein